MTVLFALLTVQAVLGLADNVINHEWKLRLPARRSARREMLLHAMRHYAYAVVFGGLAWFEWHGAWALVFGGVLLAEAGITVADFLEEERTRAPLPAGERVLHTVLTGLYGAFVALMVPVLIDWWTLPSALSGTYHAGFSEGFTLAALGVLAWGTRDLVAALESYRAPRWWRTPIAAGDDRGKGAVVVTGGTGFIGRHVVRALVERGDRAIVVSRDRELAADHFGPYADVVEDLAEIAEDTPVAAVVNLAGAPIVGLPWTAARREVLRDSRIGTTRRLVDWMARRRQRPDVLVSASAIGFYGARDGDGTLTERNAPGDEFQSSLCADWETEAERAGDLGVRVVTLRTGLVLGTDGGSYPALTAGLRLGAGAVFGAGDHWLSWIHIRDMVRLVLTVVDDPRFGGPVNAVAPIPVTQAGFLAEVGKRIGRRAWLRVPAAPVRLALGEMATLLVDGQRVIPARALAGGFRFRHGSLASAVAALEGAPRPAEHLEVYYNGHCPVCRTEMMRYQALMADDPGVGFVDVFDRRAVLDRYRLQFGHIESRLHARDSLGRVSTGMDAIRTLWARMPGFRRLVPATRLPGVRFVLDAVYDGAVAPFMTWLGRRHCDDGSCSIVRG